MLAAHVSKIVLSSTAELMAEEITFFDSDFTGTRHQLKLNICRHENWCPESPPAFRSESTQRPLGKGWGNNNRKVVGPIFAQLRYRRFLERTHFGSCAPRASL